MSSFFNIEVWGTASLGEVLWTILNAAALVYVLRNLLWLIRYYYYANTHAHDKAAKDEARDTVREEAGRLLVAVMFTGIGLVAMVTPEPEVRQVSVLAGWEALVFLLAAVVNLGNSFLTHRRLVR